MEDLKKQQVEALEVAAEYCAKLSNGIENVVKELEGDKLPDTDKYLDSVVKGLNWIFEVYNGTKDLIEANNIDLDKEDVNKAVLALNDAFKSGDDAKKAAALKGDILTFVKKMETVSSQIR